MAHFAKINDNNIVIDVLPVDNERLNGKDYPYADKIGTKYLNDNGFEGKWIQTSYNNNFRKNFASIGSIWSPEKNCFYNEEKPHEECIWSEKLMRWIPPRDRWGIGVDNPPPYPLDVI